MSARRPLIAGAAAVLAGALVLAAPLAASAHVHVTPEQAEAGSPTELVFSVPNESDSADTVRVRITVPERLGEVEAQAVHGWTARAITRAGRTAAVEYRATGDGIGQGASQSFTVKVAEVPSTGSVLLPVAQTYSDGEVVTWDEATPASGEEPEHPAPVLYVNDAPPAEHDHDADADGEEASSTAAGQQAAPDLALPTGLAAAALVVAIGALAAAVVALLRRR